MESAYILGRKQEDFESGGDDGTVCYRGVGIGHGDMERDWWRGTGLIRRTEDGINVHGSLGKKRVEVRLGQAHGFTLAGAAVVPKSPSPQVQVPWLASFQSESEWGLA